MTGWMKSQAGIKIAERNISNLRCADDTTLMPENRGTEEPLDDSEEESGKAGLKLNIQKSKGLPWSSVAKTPSSQCMGPGFNPWSGN